MEVYCVQDVLPTIIFKTDNQNEENSSNLQSTGLGNENPKHVVEFYETLPEIVNAIRRTLMIMESCAFPDTTMQEISKTREIPYFKDTFITPYVECILRANRSLLDIYEQTLEQPHITILKNTSKMKKETIIRHIAQIPINLDPELYLKCPSAFTFELIAKNNYKNNQRISVTSEFIQYKEKDHPQFNTFRPPIREIFGSSNLLCNQEELKKDLMNICVGLVNTRNDITNKQKSQAYLMNSLSEQFIHLLYLEPEQELHIEMMPMISSGNHHASFDQFNHVILHHLEDPQKIECQRNLIKEFLANPDLVDPVQGDQLIQNTSNSFLSVDSKNLMKNFELHDKQRLVKTRSIDNQPNSFVITMCRNIQSRTNNSGKKCIYKSLKIIQQSITSMIENLTLYKICDIDHPLKSGKTPGENIKINTTLIKDNDNIEHEDLITKQQTDQQENTENTENIYLYVTLQFPEILQSIVKTRKLHVSLKSTIEYFCQLILFELLIKKKEKAEITENSKVIHANKVVPLKYYGVKQSHPLYNFVETHILIPYNHTFQIDSSRLKIDDKKKLNDFAIDVFIGYYNLCLAFVKKMIDTIN